MLTDTHCHLDLDQFDTDREAVLERAAQAGISHILIPGLNIASSKAIIKLAGSNDMLYAAVGIHPTEANLWNKSSRDEITALILSQPSPDPGGGKNFGKVIAIGEIGLDYYWDSASHDIQKTILVEQLSLAAEAGLPVILHMREDRLTPDGGCAGDLLRILEEWVAGLQSSKNPLAERPGVLHSFSGSLETALAALVLGFYIGVTGAITYDKTGKRQEIVSALPLERLLIETDAPFQAPNPYRGKRNEPAYVHQIADKIATLHSCSLEQIATTTSNNASRLFIWKETV